MMNKDDIFNLGYMTSVSISSIIGLTFTYAIIELGGKPTGGYFIFGLNLFLGIFYIIMYNLKRKSKKTPKVKVKKV